MNSFLLMEEELEAGSSRSIKRELEALGFRPSYILPDGSIWLVQAPTEHRKRWTKKERKLLMR